MTSSRLADNLHFRGSESTRRSCRARRHTERDRLVRRVRRVESDLPPLAGEVTDRGFLDALVLAYEGGHQIEKCGRPSAGRCPPSDACLVRPWHDRRAVEGEVRIGGTQNWIVLSRDEVGVKDFGRDLCVWSLRVELHAEGLTAQTSIWLGRDGVEEPLNEFFRGLAVDWRGWDGTRSWHGMEGGLTLRCVNDRLSTAHVSVVLRHLSGADWTAGAVIPVDLGQLDAIAAELDRLLTV